MAALWLDDAEHAEMLREPIRVLQPRLANPRRPGRKRRILGYVLLPATAAANSAPLGGPGVGLPPVLG